MTFPKPKAYIFHDLNIVTTSRLVKALSTHFNCVELALKYMQLKMNAHRIKGIERIIAKMASPNSIAIGHGKGCKLIYKAVLAGAGFDTVILINPTLNRNTKLPTIVRQWLVLYAPSDNTGWLSRALPKRRWGRMGKYGTNNLPHVKVINLDDPGLNHGHCGFFTNSYWIDWVLSWLTPTRDRLDSYHQFDQSPTHLSVVVDGIQNDQS